MKIPEVRKELLALAEQLELYHLPIQAGKLRRLECELHRRSPVRRAEPHRRAAPDPGAIRAWATQYPTLSYMDIAELFRCSIGRVSEALAGFRE